MDDEGKKINFKKNLISDGCYLHSTPTVGICQ